MRLYGVRIFVDNYAAARTFYAERLGLAVAWDMAEMGAFGVDAGGPQLIVEAVPPGSDESHLVGRFVGVSLAVEDIELVYDSLSLAGVPFDGRPEKQPWGGTLAHFKDPAGNTLTLLGSVARG